MERKILAQIIDNIRAINNVLRAEVMVNPSDALVFPVHFDRRGDEIVIRQIW